VAEDGAQGRELWRSDGTEAGTVMVQNIWPGSDGSGPEWLTDVTLFFVAEDGAHGRELWSIEG
jgi:ELWxxDGT repeat protein